MAARVILVYRCHIPLIVTLLAFFGLGRKVSRLCGFVGEREKRYEKVNNVNVSVPWCTTCCSVSVWSRCPDKAKGEIAKLRPKAGSPPGISTPSHGSSCPAVWRNEGTILCRGASEAQGKSGELRIDIHLGARSVILFWLGAIGEHSQERVCQSGSCREDCSYWGREDL